MKHIKNFRLFEATETDKSIIIDVNTTPETFKKELEECLKMYSNGGGSQTFEDIVVDIVIDNLDKLGKSEDVKRNVKYDLWDSFLEEPSGSGIIKYKSQLDENSQKIDVCSYTTQNNDGYGFEAEVRDVTKLLEDIKEILGFIKK